MAISGPVMVGSAFQRNQAPNTPFNFNPIVPVAAGSLLTFLWGTDATDSATCSLTDSAGNQYSPQVNLSTDPGTGFCMSLFFCFQPGLALPLTTQGTITLQCSERASFGGAMYAFTGATGNLTSSLVKWSSEWGNTANPSGAVSARAGDSVFAALAVAGPSSDTLTQDTNSWAADLTAAASNFNVVVHATAKHQIGADGQVIYAPTLSAARRAVMAMFAFK